MFTLDDLEDLTQLAMTTWRAGADRDWSVPAGTLEWSCHRTAGHAADCVFAPAFFLASGRRADYPAWDDLRPLPDAGVDHLVDGLRAASTLLRAVVLTADPDTRAIIRQRPAPQTAPPPDFVPRGALELIIHTYDIASGLQVAYDPPAELVQRLTDHTATWPGQDPVEPSGDPWADMLRRYGREPGATPAP